MKRNRRRALALLGESPTAVESLQQWTRSLPIRTAARMPVTFPVLVTDELFPHQALGPKIRELARLGLSRNAIARALGVDWKTVRKALERAG